MVSVRLQTITGRSHQLEVESSLQAALLYQTAASAIQQPADKFSLVLRGQAIDNPSAASSASTSLAVSSTKGGHSIVQLNDGDVLLVAPFRAKPSARIQRAAETITGVTPADEEEDEERFVLPRDARPWERRLAAFLQHKVQLPELALVWLWTIGPHRIAVLVLVLLGARVAAAYGLGPIYLLLAIIITIFTHLGKKREGEASAYSVFNPGVRRLPGQLDADTIDQQIRQGQMM